MVCSLLSCQGALPILEPVANDLIVVLIYRNILSPHPNSGYIRPTTISNHLEPTPKPPSEITFRFLPQTEVFEPNSTVPEKKLETEFTTTTSAAILHSSVPTSDAFKVLKVVTPIKRKPSTSFEFPLQLKNLRMKTKVSTPEKEVKKFSPTKTTQRGPGATSLPQPITRASKYYPVADQNL
ncbi:hypothetical protein [Parasitella parasitica]|uniref:Uncharacterized protein n=1 Tax=Parasitella parasitica TaxID=35722 RepID=A0A0B7NBD6_9FUNG|nr:hypothetical protein [Parasitella parasitica]